MTKTTASSLSALTKNSLSVATACALPLGFLAFSDHAASAANVTFGAPTAITGSADVEDTGTTDLAVYFDNATTIGSQTVDGVTFLNGQSQNMSAGNFYGPTLTTPSSNGYSATITSPNANDQVTGYNEFNSGSTPYSNLSSAYKNLLTGAVYVQGATETLTLNGLTPGTEYQFQLFVQDPRSIGGTASRTETLTGGSDVSGVLSFNSIKSDGGTGDYIIGTFTADGTGSQAILLTGNSPDNVEQINAFVLDTVVPEPSTFCLLGLSAFGLAGWSLRRSRKQTAAGL